MIVAVAASSHHGGIPYSARDGCAAEMRLESQQAVLAKLLPPALQHFIIVTNILHFYMFVGTSSNPRRNGTLDFNTN